MRKRIGFVFLLMLLSLAVLPVRASAQGEVADTITPSIGEPGTRFLVVVNGFEANEDVIFWLNAPDGTTSSKGIYNPYDADRSGRVVLEWDAPQDTKPGNWQFVAHGTRNGVERVVSFQIGTPPPSPESGTPTSIQPPSGTPSTTFRFFANGFAADELISVDVYDPNDKALTDPTDLIVSDYSDANGRVDGSYTVPVDGAVGTWRIVLKGQTSETEITIPFEVVSPIPPSTATLSVSPGAGSPGTRFLFSGTGYTGDETLAVWMNAPDGSLYKPELETRLDEPQAGPDGRISLSWVAPRDIATGSWQIVVRGNESGLLQVANFDIQ